MASPKVVNTHPDLPREPEEEASNNKAMEEFLNSIYSWNDMKSMEQVWKEMVGGSSTEEKEKEKEKEEMTLEDYLRRGKRKDAPADKASLQRQRRMIKNRESAARSRERKQAYTVELECLVLQLEAENTRLLEEQAQIKRQRYNHLMDTIIPVIHKRKPTPMLRRLNSLHW